MVVIPPIPDSRDLSFGHTPNIGLRQSSLVSVITGHCFTHGKRITGNNRNDQLTEPEFVRFELRVSIIDLATIVRVESSAQPIGQ